MESMWETTFQLEMEETEISDCWRIIEDADLKKESGWLCYEQKTFARFTCSGCNHHWSSGVVCIMFLLLKNKKRRSGTVKMRIFRQQCRKCSFSLMEKPIITSENIRRTISNLVMKIERAFYEKNNVCVEFKPVSTGKSDGPHDKMHCEGCKLGFCEVQKFPTSHEKKTVRQQSTVGMSYNTVEQEYLKAPKSTIQRHQISERTGDYEEEQECIRNNEITNVRHNSNKGKHTHSKRKTVRKQTTIGMSHNTGEQEYFNTAKSQFEIHQVGASTLWDYEEEQEWLRTPETINLRHNRDKGKSTFNKFPLSAIIFGIGIAIFLSRKYFH
ncbi:receptor-transporting protein 2-like [Pelobates fuscus]|uniref:receptor-transporting protein 2-like n=1 Tax=Pelobates fuscus TaxID=191477 RepID=UPI002FE4D35C